jgi:hypothetical protein
MAASGQFVGRAGLIQALGPLESNSRTIAWILYAIDMAAGQAPVSLTDVSAAADAINHAVPTQQELSSSLRWLQTHGLVESQGRFHSLSERGRNLVGQSRANASTVSAVWAHLAEGIRRISAGA